MNSNAYKVLLALYWCCSRALPLSHSAAAVPQLTKIHCPPLNCPTPWRTLIEEGFIQNRRQRSSLLFGGQNCFKFLAGLACLHHDYMYEEKEDLHQDDKKKKINCTSMK